MPHPQGDTMVGPYRVERELARGGMGIVYVGVHQQLGRRAAIKVLLEEGVGGDRFRRECEALAKVDHPGIVRIHEAGLHAGRPYLAMELIVGSSLKEILATGGPWDSRRTAELGVALCDAMAHVHAAGLLHRDLKPENILIEAGDHPKITDFGLARAKGATSLTATGTMVGTPGFMPPEQAGGEKHELGPASDVYGLGATLFATLTGTPPFKGDSPMATITKIFTQPAPAPSTRQAGVDPALDLIVLRCLAKDPLARYRDAAALGEELRAYLSGELSAPRMSRKVLWLSFLGLIVLALLGGGVVLAQTRKATSPPTQAPLTARDAQVAWRRIQGDPKIPKVKAWLATYEAVAAPKLTQRVRRLHAELAWAELGAPISWKSEPKPNDPTRIKRYRALLRWIEVHAEAAPAGLLRRARTQQDPWADTETEEVPLLAKLEADHSSGPQNPLLLPDGRVLIWGIGRTCRIWDLTAGNAKDLTLSELSSRAPVHDAAPAGKSLWFASEETVLRWSPGAVVRHDLPFTVSGLLPLKRGLIVFGQSKTTDPTTGRWSLLREFPPPETLPGDELGTIVRAAIVDGTQKRVFMAGGPSKFGARGSFLRAWTLTEQGLSKKREVKLEQPGQNFTLSPKEDFLFLGFNRQGGSLYDPSDIDVRIRLSPFMAATDGDEFSTQSPGALFVNGGLLVACDSYVEENERGWLTYFNREQLRLPTKGEVQAPSSKVRPVWSRALGKNRPLRLASSRDKKLVLLGTKRGQILVLPMPTSR